MAALLGAVWMCVAAAAGAVEVSYGLLRVDYPSQAPISRLEAKPADRGFAGAELATRDNQTTGQFMGQTYELTTVATTPEEAEDALAGLLADGASIIAVLANGADLLRLVERAGEDALILNIGAGDTNLRSENCRANLFHITPSTAMRADAIAQFAIWKKWTDWFLVHGSNPDDRELAEAYRRAARKFGARIVEEREFEDTGGARRTDTGHVLVQRQLPVFTQRAKDHDIVIAADASDVFAPYLPFHLWTPRPVLGSAGLQPVTFHPAHEAWGATQFQTRFEELAGRRVRGDDYDAWLAFRVIGEAVTRTGSADPNVLRDYVLSDEFELAAFKGVPVTMRGWNGQLRQPVLLYDGAITASVSPQDGFLHQVSPLDTLGLDAPESACTAFD
ncbi:ABC transporter substrate-binding protein [Poseidonocella sedimentorum]|nr:ABC transporter substrate-binding protein [Poseidonocella sedimentorum]